MRTIFVTLEEAVELLRDEIRRMIGLSNNKAKKFKLQCFMAELVLSRDDDRDLEVVLRYWPGIMLSFVEAIYDESAVFRGLLITPLVDEDAVVETQDEELAESIEDSE